MALTTARRTPVGRIAAAVLAAAASLALLGAASPAATAAPSAGAAHSGATAVVGKDKYGIDRGPAQQVDVPPRARKISRHRRRSRS